MQTTHTHYRTHTCGELRMEHVGQTVTLAGFLENVREVGQNFAFAVLRDFYGVTQVVVENEAMWKAFKGLNKESTVQITGVVRERDSKNPKLPTGDIEVVPEAVEVLGRCRHNELPFQINRSREADESARLKYRYLDLRNPEVKNNIILRCQVVAALRKATLDHGFLEITTPILTASSPEGARDYLVPSRKHPGKFYALPQAPQQFKQLLMASGFDKYFQIAPCFRDEDARGDRSPGEFYQLDMEMAFADQEDVFAVLEDVLPPIFAKYGTYNIASQAPFRRIGYAEALPLYGLRQNVFTDPQKPMKVAPGIYPMNGATPDDPCMLTVDFALTYFLVSGEIERSNVPVNLLITDASGMSVLTAWAAGKFSSSSIKKFFDEFELDKKINNRTLVIPGKVAVMKGEIQDKLPDWNVVVGTREAVEIVKFLKDGEHIKAAEAVAATKKPKEEKKEVVDADAPIDYSKIVIPEIPHKDLGVTYKQRNVESKKFVTIGERIHCISPVIREAMATFNPDPILERAAQQIKAGATYLDVNIGPAESNGPELMTWAVKLLQENFNNVPLALDTANKKAIEAGIRVYNRTNGKPIVNSADAGSRISNIDLAAANDAIVIALCSADGIAKDNDERMHHCHTMLDRGMALGMEAEVLWFDPLFLVVKGMQDKQMDVLNAIKLFSDAGLKSTGGLSNNSNGAPKTLRPIMDSALVAMAMMQGLTSAIVNPNDLRLMETIKSCDIFKNNELYSDSYLEI